MTNQTGRWVLAGARRPPLARVAALAIPGGALVGWNVGLNLAVLSAAGQYVRDAPGFGFQSWITFALLELQLGPFIGLVIGTMVGWPVGGAIAVAWAFRAPPAAVTVLGLVVATGASFAVVTLWVGLSAEAVCFAALASTQGSAGVVLLTWLGEQRPRGVAAATAPAPLV